jgi:TatD family-associated radical SAM protein
VGVTNRLNSVGPTTLRGPGFVMPVSSQFSKLIDLNGNENIEPSSTQLFEAIDNAFEAGLVNVGSMEAEQVTFAGYGEPLLRSETIAHAATLIKEHRHGVPLRVKTNGLIAKKKAVTIATLLKASGIDKISISLISHDAKQYNDIMKPVGADFSDACSFVIACAESELEVECTTVQRSDIDVSKVRSLALSLGAHQFSAAPYFQ